MYFFVISYRNSYCVNCNTVRAVYPTLAVWLETVISQNNDALHTAKCNLEFVAKWAWQKSRRECVCLPLLFALGLWNGGRCTEISWYWYLHNYLLAPFLQGKQKSLARAAEIYGRTACCFFSSSAATVPEQVTESRVWHQGQLLFYDSKQFCFFTLCLNEYEFIKPQRKKKKMLWIVK